MTTTVSTDAGRELARIDTVLNGWETQPHGDADWLPGDPIYKRPLGMFEGEQVVRPMVQLVDDGTECCNGRCTGCEVDWSGDAPCWVCGLERPDPREKYLIPFPGAFMAQALADARAFEFTMRQVSEVMANAAPILDSGERRASGDER